MKYLEVRDQIADGDILFCSISGGFWNLVKLAQKIHGLADLSDVCHVGVAKWAGNRLYITEMDGANDALIPLSQRVDAGNKIRVVRTSYPVDSIFEQQTKDAIGYSLWDLVKIGARLVFGGGSGKDAQGHAVCSSYVSNWLQAVGWIPPSNFPGVPSPAELAKTLNIEPIFIVQD